MIKLAHFLLSVKEILLNACFQGLRVHSELSVKKIYDVCFVDSSMSLVMTPARVLAAA